MYSGSISPSQLRGKKFYIIADLRFGRSQIFAGTDELSIEWSSASKSICVSNHLTRPIEIKMEAGWGKVENAPAEATIEIPVAGKVLELREAGSFGSGIRCEIFLWVEGNDYDSREVLIIGQARVASWSAPGDPMILSIQQDAGDISARLRTGTLKGIEFPVEDPVADTIDRTYPIVFGIKQSSSAVRPDETRRSEGVPLTQNPMGGNILRVMIAGHKVEATEVLVFDSSGNSETLPLEDLAREGFGRVVYVYVGTSVLLEIAPGTTYSVRWSSDGGCLVDHGVVLRGAGHLVEYLLRQSEVPVDWARVASARITLDSYQVAGTIQESVQVLAYIGDAIASVLPMTLSTGPSGWFPWVWPLVPHRSDSKALIDPSQGDCVRNGELVLSTGEVLNQINLTFSVDQFSGETTKGLVVGGDGSDIVIEACRASQAAYGVRSTDIESVIMESVGTASRAATARLGALSLPRARIKYDLPPSYAWLRHRDIVEVSDSEVNAHGLAVVDKIDLSELGIQIEVVMLVNFDPE